MYRTQKYNNANRHELDRFNVLQAAIKSAKALHNPDWPVWQGIRVLDDDGMVLFDSAARRPWDAQKSSVSARMNELKKAGRIEFVGYRKSKTAHITSEFWKVKGRKDERRTM